MNHLPVNFWFIKFHNFPALIGLLILIYSCNSAQNNSNQDIDQKIDSLIEVVKISDQFIIIHFGADAISAINTKKGIVVIDAGISTWLTAKYKMVIENIFKGNRFTYVINTHGHSDHYGGNSVFTEAKVVAHVNCPEEMQDQWKSREGVIKGLSKIVKDYEASLKTLEPKTVEWIDAYTQKMRYHYALVDAKNKTPLKDPDITFADSLNLDMDDIGIEMLYFGKCHSNSDILVYIPQLKTIFAGDLFFKYGKLSINDPDKSDRKRWEKAVLWTEKRLDNIEYVIGGHGQIMTRDDLVSFLEKILE